MNNIRNVNLQKVNIQGNKIEAKKEEKAPIKTVQQGSLDGINALGNYNKMIAFKGANIDIPETIDDIDNLDDIDEETAWLLTLKYIEELDKKEAEGYYSDDNETNEETDKDLAMKIGYKVDSNWSEHLEEIKNAFKLVNVEQEDIHNLFKLFFSNKPEVENVITTADITKYKRKGLPLKYSREDFIKDLSKNATNRVMEKLGINPIFDNNYNLVGFDGIINPENLNRNDEIENNVYKIANRFVKENEVQTDNEELNKSLNALIKGMPEFVSIIGKKQHINHEYSLDIHILSVLQKSMQNKKYSSLNDADKTILKWTTVLHDIAKQEMQDDKLHPENSANFARNIMERYKFSPRMKERIYEQIKNHHWLKGYNKEELSPKDIAIMFREKQDLQIARIIAEADIKSITNNGFFWDSFKSALDDEMQTPIDSAKQELNKTGQLLYTTKIINPKKIPTVEHNGQEYRVVDFTKFSDKKIKEIFGTTKQDIQLVLHAVTNNDKAIDKLNTVVSLGDIASDNVLSGSLISLSEKKTINGYGFGVAIEAQNDNISNAYRQNQYSGTLKNFEDFKKLVKADEEVLQDFKTTIPSAIQKELGLTQEEYGELYNQISKINYPTIIKKKKFNINGKQIDGNDVLKAMKSAGKELLRQTRDFNEICIYKPKTIAFIAMVDSLDKIPQRFLDFANDNNLPIFLLGN